MAGAGRVRPRRPGHRVGWCQTRPLPPRHLRLIDLDMNQVLGTGSGIEGLRVVQITALGISAKSFLIEHFRRLREAGAEVTLICTGDADARVAAERGGIRLIPVAIRQDTAPLADLVSLIQLWRLFRRLRPDVLHAHMAKAGLLGALAGRLAGVPVRIYHNHGLAMLSAHGARRHVLRAIDWLTNRLATHALFCSCSTRNAGIDTGTVMPERSRVLGGGTISGVNVEVFKPAGTGHLRAAQRQAWGIEEETIVVGFVGRLVAHKGIETLIDAWRQLGPAVRSRACLILAGGQAYSEPKMGAIVEAALSEDIGVKAVGWVDDMVGCYSGMDLLVLPSWHEGFPYSILEAQCMGLPVIATRATGNLDAVIHERTGLLVPLRDASALAQAIARLIRSSEDRQQLGEGGRRRILEEFTQDRVLQHMLDFYQSEVAASRLAATSAGAVTHSPREKR